MSFGHNIESQLQLIIASALEENQIYLEKLQLIIASALEENQIYLEKRVLNSSSPYQ